MGDVQFVDKATIFRGDVKIGKRTPKMVERFDNFWECL